MAGGLRLTTAVTIRPCEERDLEGFERLGGSHHAEYCREQFARGSEELTILVAVDHDGVPVGKLHLDFDERADRQEAVLVAAAVAREARSRGIGTQLVLRAEELALERGCRAIVLGVEDFNPRARRLYERLGYAAFAVHDFRYAGAPVPNPGVWMRKELVLTEPQVWEALEAIPDPEIPVVSLVDLGVIRSVDVSNGHVRIEFTPTFLGCPALEFMKRAIEEKVPGAEVQVIQDDSWSTDKITPAGREKLRAAGFAPPAPRLVQLQSQVHRCPYCGSTETRLENIFGPTPCRSLRYCESCRQPFEQFKTI
ncbi:MAG TPA: 1,2-phenylacetyl-CoA epoxidase subunit PaaD [Gaiellaceae bacterium]